MNELTSVNEPASGRLSASVAFALAAGVIGLCLAASATPSPLYKLYQAQWHFSTPTLTLVYATYPFGVLFALLLFGRISDILGRRPVIRFGLAGLFVSMVLFAVASSVTWLYVARGLQGVSTGIAISAAGAALLELHRDGARAGLLNVVASALGVGLGGLLGAVLVQYTTQPLVFPFVVLIALIVVLLAGGLFMPETVAPGMRTGFRMARPGVPRETLAPFIVAALGVTAAWSTVGLYLALVPALAPALMDTQSYLAAGAAIFALGGAAAASPLISRRRTAPTQIVLGMLALTAGIGLMAISLSTGSAPVFIAASLVIGAGVGLGMLGALRVLGAAAPPNHRARVMAAWYIVAYSAISIPAIGAGYTVRAAGAVQTFWIFGAGIAVVSLGTLLLVLARQGSAKTASGCGNRTDCRVEGHQLRGADVGTGSLATGSCRDPRC